MNGQCGFGFLPFQGATSSGMGTQGVAHIRSLALGLEFDGLSDRLPFGSRNDFGLTQRRKDSQRSRNSFHTDFEFENKAFVRFELFVFQEKNLYLRDYILLNTNRRLR